MFKLIQENKIKDIREENTFNMAFMVGEIVEDTEHSVSDYEQHNGEYLLKSDIPAPSEEEQKEKRAQAYLLEVDPITAHIQRLRDDAQTTEDLSKIEELMLERDTKVEEIKNRYPYPEEEE